MVGLKKFVWPFKLNNLPLKKNITILHLWATQLQSFCNKCYISDRYLRSDVGEI